MLWFLYYGGLSCSLCCSVQFSSVQLLCGVWLFATQRNAAGQASLSITNFWILLKLMPIASVVTSNHLILCQLLLLLPSIFPRIRVFSIESVLHIRCPKYWSFSLASALPMNIKDWFPLESTGLISLQSKGLSRVFSTPQFKSINSLALSFLYSPTLNIRTWLLEKP